MKACMTAQTHKETEEGLGQRSKNSPWRAAMMALRLLKSLIMHA